MKIESHKYFEYSKIIDAIYVINRKTKMGNSICEDGRIGFRYCLSEIIGNDRFKGITAKRAKEILGDKFHLCAQIK